MAFTFTVTDNDAHSATVSKSVIGRAGEAGEVMTVNISSTLGALGYTAYMHFLLPNGDSVYKGPYVCSTNTFSVTIGATDNVLAYEGNLVIQFVLQNGTAVIWKSEEKTVKINGSVSASLPASPSDKHWVEIPASFTAGHVASYNQLTNRLTDLGIPASDNVMYWYNALDYGITADGVFDNTTLINDALATLSVPAVFFIPVNTKWNYDLVTHPDDVRIIDESTYDWDLDMWTAQLKDILKASSPGTKNANEKVIMSPYHPALVLDIRDAAGRASIVYRREGSGSWQMMSDLYSGNNIFIIKDLASTGTPAVFEVYGGNGAANEVAFNGVPSEAISYKFISRYVGNNQVQFTSSDTDKDTLLQIFAAAVEKWRITSSASDGTLTFNSRTSPTKSLVLYPNGEIKFGSSARKITNGTKPSSGSDAWTQGDIWLNASMDAGESVGEICTASGSPGTWIPFARTSLDTSLTWDAGSISAGANEVKTGITITGAALGDFVQASCSISLAGLTLTGYVDSTNTISLVLHNGTSGAVNLANATYYVRLQKRA